MEEKSEDYLQVLKNQIKSEVPKLGDSIKNLISVVLGNNYNPNVQFDSNPQKLLRYAKEFLNSIQTYELEDPNNHFNIFSQSKSQTGADRLDEICKYKAVYELRKAVILSNARVSKLFGLQYFTWTSSLKVVIDRTLKALSNDSKIEMEEAEMFFELYSNSIVYNNGNKFYF
jgi:hypothetical protein